MSEAVDERELDRMRLRDLILCQEMTKHTHVAQLFVTKGSGCIEYCNPKAQSLWPHLANKNCHQTVEEMIDRHSWKSDGEKQEVLCRYRELTPKSEPFEVVCACTGSHDAFHRMTFTPCSHPVTGEDAVTISEFDISDLKRVEAKLVEELRAQELTFNSISHELRAPLNGIVGLTDCALQSNDVPSNFRKSLKVIKATGQRMAGLVDDLLDAVSTRQSKLVIRHEMCDVNEISQEVIEIMTPLVRRNVTIHNRVPQSLRRIEGDSRRISQILTNLLSNACKFTSTGSISVDAEQIGERIRLSVIDTGLGIPSDKLESIFGAFQQVDERTTRQYGGTGLGLTLVKSLVEAHHGSITVSSVFSCAGSGTTFAIELPLVQSEEHTHAVLCHELSSSSSTLSSSETHLTATGSDHLAMLRAEEEAGKRSQSCRELEQQVVRAEAEAQELRARVKELTAQLLQSREDSLRAERTRSFDDKLCSAVEQMRECTNDMECHRPSAEPEAKPVLRCESSSSRGVTPPWTAGLSTEPKLAQLNAEIARAFQQGNMNLNMGAGPGLVPRTPSFTRSSSSASSASSTCPLQGVLMQHMLEREELLERKLFMAMHAQQGAEKHALRREHSKRSMLADSIVFSIQGARVPT